MWGMKLVEFSWLPSPTPRRRDSPHCELFRLRDCHEWKFGVLRMKSSILNGPPLQLADKHTVCVTVNKQEPSASSRSTSLFKSRRTMSPLSAKLSVNTETSWKSLAASSSRTEIRRSRKLPVSPMWPAHTGLHACLLSLYWRRGSRSALFTSSSSESVQMNVWLSARWNIGLHAEMGFVYSLFTRSDLCVSIYIFNLTQLLCFVGILHWSLSNRTLKSLLLALFITWVLFWGFGDHPYPSYYHHTQQINLRWAHKLNCMTLLLWCV